MVIAFALATSAVEARAHTITLGPKDKRVYGCGVSGKYSCQSHYLYWKSSDGWLWTHTHACTTDPNPGSDGGETWRVRYHSVQGGFEFPPHAPSWWSNPHAGEHQHSDQWCGWVHHDHDDWSSNLRLKNGTGTAEVSTEMCEYPSGPTPVCTSGESSYEPGVVTDEQLCSDIGNPLPDVCNLHD